MSFHEVVPADKKWRERRRGVRVNSSVGVQIAWHDPEGNERHREAVTRMVSPYGCLVVLPENLAIEQPVQLTNLANSLSVQAMVVWKGRERVEGWELGIGLVNLETDFWGLDL